MNKEEYKKYLESDHWKNLRRKALEAAGYKCSRCGSSHCLQPHHLRYRNIFDVLVSDLIVLCRYCHEKEHGIVSGFRPVKPDIKKLLRGVFNKPIKFKPSPVMPNSQTKEQRRAILKSNKLNNSMRHLKPLMKESGIWRKTRH